MNYNDLSNNVYYDANIINADTTGKKAPPQLVFQDIRSTPILSEPEKYEVSVVRFNLQIANSLPIWIPQIQFDQDNRNVYNPNLTSYSFHLTYNYQGIEYEGGEVNVIYTPCDFSVSPPSKVTTYEDMHVPYYFVKSFTQIVEMFNNALSQAFIRLQDVVSYYGVSLPSENPPFYEWNSDSSKFILNADVNGYDSSELDHISIYCNTPLYTLMSGFQGDYYGIDAKKGKNYKFKIKKELRALNLFTVTDTYSVIQLYQEYSSGSLFTPVSSIVFTTSMPVLPTNSTKPTIFNGTSTLTNSGNNNNIVTMLTDFQSQDNNGYGFCNSLAYIPSAEYRFMSLNQGSSKLTNIDLSVFWLSRYGSMYPIYLMPGCKCDLKLLFRLKNI